MRTTFRSFSEIIPSKMMFVSISSMTIQSAWTFTVGVSALAFVDLQFTSPNIVANASFSNWNANVTLLQSQIGTIFTFGIPIQFAFAVSPNFISK